MSPESIARTPVNEYCRCPEWERLYSMFVSALSEVIGVEIDQSQVDYPERIHFDRLLREAVIREQSAKQALILHLRTHPRCGASAAD